MRFLSFGCGCENLPIQIEISFKKNIVLQVFGGDYRQSPVVKINVVFFNARRKIGDLCIDPGLPVEFKKVEYPPLVTQIIKIILVYRFWIKVLGKGIGDAVDEICGGVEVVCEQIIIGRDFCKVFFDRVGSIRRSVGAEDDGVGIGNEGRIKIIKYIIGESPGTISSAADEEQIILSFHIRTHNGEPSIP